MAEMLVQSENLVAIANEIRILGGTEDNISLSDMKTILEAIPKNDSDDLIVEGTTVIVPAGYYASQVSKSIDEVESNTTILYEINNQHIDVTGGWGSIGWSSPYSYTIKAPTINDSGMTITGYDSSGFGLSGTQNKIDLRNMRTLYVTIDQFALINPQIETAYLAVNHEKKAMIPGTPYTMTAMQQITGTGEIALNVGDIDEGYIVLFVHCNQASSIKVTQIRME